MKFKLTLLVLLLATLLSCANNPPPAENLPTAAATVAATNTPPPTAEAGGGDAPTATAEPPAVNEDGLLPEEEAEVAALLDELINPPTSAIPAPVDLQGAAAGEIFGDSEYVRLLTFEGLAVPLCLQGNRVEEGAFLGGAVFMAECRNVTNQYWRATREDSGYYTLQTLAHEGDNTCLEGNVRSEIATLGGAAFLDGCSAVSGQDWKFVDRGDGTYRMQTQFLEPENLCFDGNIVDPGSVLQGASYMTDCAEVPGQIWIVEPVFDTSAAVEAAPVAVIDTRVIEPVVIPAEENTRLVQIGTADGLCLEGRATPYGEPADGPVALVDCSDAPSLLWQFVTTADPAYYTLQTLASQEALKCLDSNSDVAGAPFDGAPYINDCSGGASQNWRIVITAAESARIQSQASLAANRCLTVSVDNLVSMETCQVGDSQAWAFAQSELPIAYVPEGGPRMVAPDDLVAAGSVSGAALNALTGAALAGVEVCLQGTDQCTTTDAAGSFSFSDVPAGEVALAGSLAGYLDATATASVAAGETATRNVVLSPELTVGGASVRVILTWETAGDVDANLRVPGDAQNAPTYVFYDALGTATAFPFATLDKDDRVATGPETVTIEQQRSGTYAYIVRDYRGLNTLADATVQVYNASGLIAEFDGPSEPATLWHVFNLNGDTGEVQPVNAILTAFPDAADPVFEAGAVGGGAALCSDIPAPTGGGATVRFVNTSNVPQYVFRGAPGPDNAEAVEVVAGGFSDQAAAEGAEFAVYSQGRPWEADDSSVYYTTGYTVSAQATQCVTIEDGP